MLETDARRSRRAFLLGIRTSSPPTKKRVLLERYNSKAEKVLMRGEVWQHVVARRNKLRSSI